MKFAKVELTLLVAKNWDKMTINPTIVPPPPPPLHCRFPNSSISSRVSFSIWICVHVVLLCLGRPHWILLLQLVLLLLPMQVPRALFLLPTPPLLLHLLRHLQTHLLRLLELLQRGQLLQPPLQLLPLPRGRRGALVAEVLRQGAGGLRDQRRVVAVDSVPGKKMYSVFYDA